jgi:hypothetical protein
MIFRCTWFTRAFISISGGALSGRAARSGGEAGATGAGCEAITAAITEGGAVMT